MKALTLIVKYTVIVIVSSCTVEFIMNALDIFDALPIENCLVTYTMSSMCLSIVLINWIITKDSTKK